MNWKKWLILDPRFLVVLGFMALFNYFFDQTFRRVVYLNPHLSFLYVFQYHLILPLINVAFLSALFFIMRHLRTGRRIRR